MILLLLAIIVILALLLLGALEALDQCKKERDGHFRTAEMLDRELRQREVHEVIGRRAVLTGNFLQRK